VKRACLLVVAAVLVMQTEASAQTKQECVNAYTEAQVLRTKGKLREAKKALAICVEEACPQTLRKDCVPWLGEVEKALPSVVVEVSDDHGAAIAGARVTVDDQAAFSGQVTRVDPGDHAVSIEAAGYEPHQERVQLSAGDTRTVRVQLHALPTTPVAAPKSVVPIAPFVVTGLGLVGVGLFAGFGLAGNGIKSDLDAQGCKPNCPVARVDAIKTDYVVADVALGVGLACVIAGTILFIVMPWHEVPKTSMGPGGLVVRF
jgi:hypothetical protein